jgi:hypothetical protein
LKENLPPNLSPFDKLQDIIGTLVKLDAQRKEATVKKPADSTAATVNKSKYLPLAFEVGK